MSRRAARSQVPRSGSESASPEEKGVDTCSADGAADGCRSGEDSSASDSSSTSGDESDAEELHGGKAEEQEREEVLPPPRCLESDADSLPQCEHCRYENDQREHVMPRRLSGEQYLLKLDGEGSYQCRATGLIFEVAGAAAVRYAVLSWSKYAALVGDAWMVGGPLFDVGCAPAGALAAIGFPHALCLGGSDARPAFKVLHVKEGAVAALEAPAEYTATHVRWLVSSLSPVGPLLRVEEPVLYHGAVVLYKVVDNHPSLSFRVYVATNNDSFIKDISKAVKQSGRKFMKIDKPPVCLKQLQKGKRYRLVCEPEAEITPEEIEFLDGSLLKLKSYIEVYLEKPDDFTLSLIELESEEVVWKAKLRERDWIHHDQNRNEQKKRAGSVKRRQPTQSFSEDEGYCQKKRKGSDTADGIKTKSLLTDQQLMAVAKKFGREWKEVAIECLQLEMKDIHQIQAKEEEVNIHKFMMLSKWREREKSNGTARSLYDSLKDKVSYDIVEMLEETEGETCGRQEEVRLDERHPGNGARAGSEQGTELKENSGKPGEPGAEAGITRQLAGQKSCRIHRPEATGHISQSGFLLPPPLVLGELKQRRNSGNNDAVMLGDLRSHPEQPCSNERNNLTIDIPEVWISPVNYITD